MANWFVWSAAGGTPDGLAWDTAYLTVNDALADAGFAAGDIILVSSDHSYNGGAANSWLLETDRQSVISVDRDGNTTGTSHAGYLAGAVEQAISNGGNMKIRGSNGTSLYPNIYVKGFTFTSGSGGGGSGSGMLLGTGPSDNNSTGIIHLDDCQINLNGSHETNGINIGPMATNTSTWPVDVLLTNCTAKLPGNSSAAFLQLGYGRFRAYNLTLELYSTAPTNLIRGQSNCNAFVEIHDSDLSVWSGTTILDASDVRGTDVLLRNCELHANVVNLTDGSEHDGDVQLVNCDSGDTMYTMWKTTAGGTIQEDTSTYATAGASVEGTALSWSVTPTLECDISKPIRLPPIGIYNTVTSSQTATVEFISDFSADLTDDEIWMELSYPGDAAKCISHVATDRNVTPGYATDETAHGAGADTWTESLTGERKQKLSITFTAARAGPIEARIFVGAYESGKELYIDPLLRVA